MTISALNTSWAYDGEVHSKINESAVIFSQLDFVLKNQLTISSGTDYLIETNGQTKKIWQWLSYGGEAEDYGKNGEHDYRSTRAFNHFHDPLNEWNKAGLDNWFWNEEYKNHFGRYPVSAILWGVKPGEQDFDLNKPETGDWSWGSDESFFGLYA